ncbi:division/cell wall cluster transcriptional repressor MraZ [Azospirillum brasilense]|uniref:Transcriptional regulator MraZ n=1 Tax=Azospirillum brasilense TaxID=192 RepID=A0A6L3B6Q7_AZOBR|nr:MraZ family transcriptional regulator [Azospirillum brasilense]KAA0688352.1 MraZ family transcriptional regulator [Azospirillum brasilense]
MAIFLSTYVNKVDRKGRCSIPAQFRQSLAKTSAPGTVYLWPSLNHQALEGADQDYLDVLSESLESPDLDSDERDMIETFIFGKLIPVSLDTEGRIVLPKELAEFAGIDEEAAFIGRRKTFQIWEPGALKAHEQTLRDQVVRKDISLSQIVAKASRAATGRAGEGA